MTLLELLRQELPKRGGWPEGVDRINQGWDGRLEKYGEDGESYNFGTDMSFPLTTDHRVKSKCIHECGANFVTREQYEVTGWDGTGLPPVGAECESKQFAQIDWHKFRVVAVENGHVFGFWNDKVGVCLDSTHWEFRPLRTEAERKREAAVGKIFDVICKSLTDESESTSFAIYDAIAAGEIPGVKLEV